MSSSRIPKPSLIRPSSISNSNTRSQSTTNSSIASSFLSSNTENVIIAPTSLLSGALPPSLLSTTEEQTSIPPRPRRLWTIEDTSLKPTPAHYPPMNRRYCTYIGDASPSVVAVRISECFRKRSIAVEYDDEAITATAMTVDRCLFSVQLWKGKQTDKVDFSHGVVVECTPISSNNSIPFHQACRAILQAALGQSDGVDNRPSHKRNGLEFPAGEETAIKKPKLMTSLSRQSTASSTAARGLEQARELIKKDRFDTQLLGMQQLVHLTSSDICGTEHALYVSKQMLDETWLFPYVVSEEHDEAGTFTASSENPKSTPSKGKTMDDCRHESRMRAFALRAFCNALESIAAAQEFDCLNPLWMQPPLLQSLVDDLQGSNRPPSVVEMGYQLASAHEAALAAKCLRIFGEQLETAQKYLQSDHVLEKLELARTCGRATHTVLQHEAESTYQQVSEDFRSC